MCLICCFILDLSLIYHQIIDLSIHKFDFSKKYFDLSIKVKK